MRVLDLFSGSGGAGYGYALQGHDVTAVDTDASRLTQYLKTQDYVDSKVTVIQGDALKYAIEHAGDFDLVHASPPCQGYSIATSAIDKKYPMLIAATREILLDAGVPFVIENVYGARKELVNPFLLCWSMFREPGSVLDLNGTPLTMRRHRVFETNFHVEIPQPCRHPKGVQIAGAYGGARRDPKDAREVRHGGYVPPTLSVLRDLCGVPWADEKGCFLSIPPEYTSYIVSQLESEISF